METRSANDGRMIQQGPDGTETLLKILVQEAKEYAIFQIDLDGTILNWNIGAVRMKQFTCEEAIGKNFRMLYEDKDQIDGRPELNIQLAIKHGRHEEKWWRRKKDGTLFWANSVTTPIYSPSGVLLNLSKIVRDLSAEKRTENDLQAAKKSAQAASGLKALFVTNISHEIRTPLNSILGFSEMLKDSNCVFKDRLVAVNAIERNSTALLGLIEDILDISKVEIGKLEITVIPIHLRSLIHEIIAHFEPLAHAKGLLLKIKINADTPEIINSDPRRLRQIINNIIGNALKFTDHGEIAVSVDRAVLQNNINGIEIEVTDTGPGLTSEEQKNLFTAFAQTDSTSTRKCGGTGLGLVLGRRLAEKLGGDVRLSHVESPIGCTFRITIAEMELGPAGPKKNPTPPMKKASTTTNSKILIVDDSPDNQLLLKVMLRRWGVKADFAENGIAAVEMALKIQYDLILMDIQMPFMDGNEAMRKLRNAGYTLPIVAVTAHAMQDDKAKSFDAGCDDYITKPIDKSRLYKILETYVHRDVGTGIQNVKS